MIDEVPITVFSIDQGWTWEDAADLDAEEEMGEEASADPRF